MMQETNKIILQVDSYATLFFEEYSWDKGKAFTYLSYIWRSTRNLSDIGMFGK